jgi:hypothetical protein
VNAAFAGAAAACSKGPLTPLMSFRTNWAGILTSAVREGEICTSAIGP